MPAITANLNWLSDSCTKPLTTFQQRFLLEDWASTDLGPLHTWDQRLNQLTRDVICNDQASVIFWGEKDSMLFNESYQKMWLAKAEMDPEKASIPYMKQGMQGKDYFKEAWPQLHAVLIEARMKGDVIQAEEIILRCPRAIDQVEELNIQFQLTPLICTHGKVTACYGSVTDVTAQTRASRRKAALTRLEQNLLDVSTIQMWAESVVTGMTSEPKDICVALMYIGEGVGQGTSDTSDEQLYILQASSQTVADAFEAPHTVHLSRTGWLTNHFKFARLQTAAVIALAPETSKAPSTGNADYIPDKYAIYCVRFNQKEVAYLVIGFSTIQGCSDEARLFVRSMIDMTMSPHLPNMLLNQQFATTCDREKENAKDIALMSLHLSEMEAKFLKFTEHVPVAFAVHNTDGVALAANNAWKDLSQLSIGSSLAHWDHVFPIEEANKLRESWDTVMRTKAATTLYINSNSTWKTPELDANGQPRYVPISVITSIFPNLNREGEVTSIMSCSSDVTELRWVEAELRAHINESANILREQEICLKLTESKEAAAQEASRLKSQFLANMSHEIRNPIAQIIGMSEILCNMDVDGEQQTCAVTIQRCANGLLSIIDDILDLSKVESGHLDLEQVKFSLTVMLQDVSGILCYAAKQKGVSFESDFDFERSEGLFVLGDPGRLKQIISNVASNSIKFTPKGTVRLSARIQADAPEYYEVTFVVQDTGIGITEEGQKRLFTPFTQADESTTRKFGGSGLGLTICKKLIEMMNGSLVLKSEYGVGTEVSFSLRMKKPSSSDDMHSIDVSSMPMRLQSDISIAYYTEPPKDSHSQLKAVSTPYTMTRWPSVPRGMHAKDLSAAEREEVTILIAEDNPINQQIALKTLQRFGFKSVLAVWNGKEVIDHMTKTFGTEQYPDLILMDVQMPVLDGYRATHILRYHSPFKSIAAGVPIIALTASAIQGDREKCTKAGMDDYLAKPVRAQTLEAMLLKWIFYKRNTGIGRPQQSKEWLDSPQTCLSDCGHTSASPLSSSSSSGSSSITPQPLK